MTNDLRLDVGRLGDTIARFFRPGMSIAIRPVRLCGEAGSHVSACPVSATLMVAGAASAGQGYDAFGSYAWLIIEPCGSGVGAVTIAFTFRLPRSLRAALPAPSVAP